METAEIRMPFMDHSLAGALVPRIFEFAIRNHSSIHKS
jgi:hypothetical protein